jgi:hypothetical protein
MLLEVCGANILRPTSDFERLDEAAAPSLSPDAAASIEPLSLTA